MFSIIQNMNQLLVEQIVLPPNYLKLIVKGDLDAGTAIEMDDIIKQALDNKYFIILLNCTDLKYISSAGLGVFISYLEDIKTEGGSFVFYNMLPSVYNVFELLGLHRLLTIVENETAALLAI